ncbi:MAG: tRNA lysidine(34) synthetase TilS [Limisphaerales bacterium]
MSEFLSRLEREIQSRGHLGRGEKILAAVSGGLDSMTLLHVLQALAGKCRWQIVVAHFNHQLRGRSSDTDEKLVRKTAAVLGLPFVAGRADVKSFAQKSGLSIEMAARKIRHEFFARTARERKISTVALAHHADDQVELFFLRVLRGAGGVGLAGMKWHSSSPVDKKITIVRPLLGFSKNEITAFAREHRVAFREDVSNFSNDFLRNRVRNELLPLLREYYQPGLAKTVLRLIDIVGAETEVVGQLAGNWLKQRRPNFENLPVAVQRRIVQAQLEQHNVAVDFNLVEQLCAVEGKFVSIGPGLSISRSLGGDLKLREQSTVGFNSQELPVNLGGAGDMKFDGVNFTWSFSRKLQKCPPFQAQREFFDAAKVGSQITLRHWRPGDRFQPSGLKKAAKLQDLFTNAKIPRGQRRDLVVALAADGEIFWVEGLRISENFKLTPETGRRLVWRWSRHQQ